MGRRKSGGVPIPCALVALGVAVGIGPARGQPVALIEPPPLPRVSAPVIEPVVLEGDRLPEGKVASLARAQINRQGEIAFAATVALGPILREGLFVRDGGVPQPLALQGQPVDGRGLLPLNGFGNWAWSDGGRAVFLAAVDGNGNGRFDPGVDPLFLFAASRGSLTPLVGIGDRFDGGTLLAIRSFRLNASGRVAIQAEIDRNGNGSFDPGTDSAGIYLLSADRLQPLIQEGERVGNDRVRGLDMAAALPWQLNDRGQVVVEAGLEHPIGSLPVRPAILVADSTGIPFRVYAGLSTAFGTLDRLGSAVVDDAGEIVFSAALGPGLQPPIALFRSRTVPPLSPLELLAGPGITGPTGTLVANLLLPVAANDRGVVGFCGSYDQAPLGVEGVIPDPAACFIQAPEFLYEVARLGAPTPWGEVGGLEELALNNLGHAAVQAVVTPLPFVQIGRPDSGQAIFFWENGSRVAVVGPGDVIPGGRVGPLPSLTGLSDSGSLAFQAIVTDAFGISRRGVFAVPAPGR